MILEWLRLSLYVLAIVLSLAMAGRLFPVRNRLAMALSLVMIAWAGNAAMLAAMLVYSMLDPGGSPSWRGAVTTIDALLLAATVIMLYAIFPGGLDRVG